MPTHLTINGIWIDVSLRETHGISAELTQHAVEEGADITDHVRAMPTRLTLEGVVSNQPIELPGSHATAIAGALGTSVIASELGFMVLSNTYYDWGTKKLELVGPQNAAPPYIGNIPIIGNVASLLDAFAPGWKPNKKVYMIVPDRAPVPAGQARSVSLTFDRPFNRVEQVETALRNTINARAPVTIVTALRKYDNVVLSDLSIERNSGTGSGLHFGCTGQVIRTVASELATDPDPAQTRAQKPKDKGSQNTQNKPPSPEVKAKSQSVGKFWFNPNPPEP
jgi:hypothetical protein